MRPFWQDPLSTFCDAVESVVGWESALVCTTLSGIWLGMWLGSGKLPGIEGIAEAIAWFPVLLLLVFLGRPWLPFLLLLLWYVAYKYESFGLTVCAAVVNWLVWLAAGAAVSRWI